MIYGTGIYWHGILNYDNRDNRRVEEVKRTFRGVQKIQCVKVGKGKAVYFGGAFLLNYTEETLTIPCRAPLCDLIAEAEYADRVRLDPLDVAVLKRK